MSGDRRRVTDAPGMQRFDLDEVLDVVVVGTGAGGAPLLARLAQAGLRVVALEAGPDFAPAEFTPDELESTEINWMSDRLSGGADPTAFGPNNSGYGVGGSTLHWGAFTPRPDARDLQLRSETGEGRDWPIDHAELIRYIERVESDIGVSGPAHYPWDPSRRYAYPPVRRNGSSDVMIRGCDALGITATDGPAAILTHDRDQPHFGVRPATLDNGDIHQGDRFGAKATTANTYLPAAVAAGAEVRPDAFVHGIERDAAGRVTAVVYRSGGVELRQRCAALVLAAGGVETPRLLKQTCHAVEVMVTELGKLSRIVGTSVHVVAEHADADETPRWLLALGATRYAEVVAMALSRACRRKPSNKVVAVSIGDSSGRSHSPAIASTMPASATTSSASISVIPRSERAIPEYLPSHR